MARPMSAFLRQTYRDVADQIEATNRDEAAKFRAKAAAGSLEAEQEPTGIERSQPREREPGED